MTQQNKPNETAIKAAENVIDELNSRKGFDYFWGTVDDTIQQQIITSIARVIQNTYTTQNEE